ncbi:unnamed protein product [Dovyalis caffra]|uniref:Uncharacterized protein n=1 Tax=Dovyalis caffra TaxID=77055 RepID=A0AAV1RDT0_9ROSI|nr:unnamed protein product [Dovyalis caffra]
MALFPSKVGNKARNIQPDVKKVLESRSVEHKEEREGAVTCTTAMKNLLRNLH